MQGHTSISCLCQYTYIYGNFNTLKSNNMPVNEYEGCTWDLMDTKLHVVSTTAFSTVKFPTDNGNSPNTSTCTIQRYNQKFHVQARIIYAKTENENGGVFFMSKVIHTFYVIRISCSRIIKCTQYCCDLLISKTMTAKCNSVYKKYVMHVLVYIYLLHPDKL